MLSAIPKPVNFSIFRKLIGTSRLFEIEQRSIPFQNRLIATNACLCRKVNRLRMTPVNEANNDFIQDPEYFGKIMGLDPDEIELDDIDLDVEKKAKINENPTLAKKEKCQEKYENLRSIHTNETVSAIKDETEPEQDSVGTSKRLRIIELNEKSSLLSSKVGSLKSKKGRDRIKKIILEGKRLIKDAISAGHQPEMLFFSRREDLKEFDLSERVTLYRTSYKSIEVWSDVVTTQGILGIFKLPNFTCNNAAQATVPLTVICDNVREPGNLGAILRVVASVGCKKILLTKGCVDLWDSKVLRAAAGSHFRLPVQRCVEWTDIAKEVDEEDLVLIADSSNQLVHSGDDSDLPLHCYTSLETNGKNVTLIIGGETRGLSCQAYEFGKNRRGVRVHIPMANNVESLNSAVVAGILCYELRRQGVSHLDTKKTEEE